MANLFVYGTLKKEMIESVMPHLLPYLQFSGYGCVKGRLFDVVEYPGAISDGNSDNQVFGQLFAIGLRFEAEILTLLDAYEYYDEKDVARSLFRRELATIYRKDANAISAWIYWYNKPVTGLTEIISGTYSTK